MSKRIVTESEWWSAMKKAGHEGRHIEGGVTFSNDCIKTGVWNKCATTEDGLWSYEERTYECSSGEKAFGDYAGYSIFASNLAMTDFARIEHWFNNKKYVVEEYYLLED